MSSKNIARLIALVFCAVVVVGAAVWVSAGTTGTVAGSVKDAASGAPLSGANVIVNGTGLSTVTDAQGRFVITNVPPGDYEVTVEMVGYASSTQGEVQVVMDATAAADFTLAQKAIEEETVVVTRPRPMINPEVVNTFNLLNANQEPMTRTDPASTRTAPGILSSLPGVLMEPDGSGQMHLRGGKADQVGWYVDDIPITDPNTGMFSTDGYTTGLSKFQMYTGAFGAEYGNAISGVLNEVKKTGATTPGISFDTEGGTDTFGSMSGQIGGGTAETFNYYASSSVLRSDLDGPMTKNLEYADNVAKLVWPSGKNTYSLLAMQGSQVGELSENHTIDVYNNAVPSTKDFLRQRYAVTGFTWSHSFSPEAFITVQPYYGYFTSVINAMGGSIGGSPQGSDVWSSRWGLQAKYTNQLSSMHTLKAGGSVLKSDNNYYLAFSDRPFFEADVDTFQHDLFVEDQMTLGERWNAAAGLRYESITYDRIGGAYNAGTGDYTGAPLSDIDESKISPRLGISYSPDKRSVWKANWGQYCKFVAASAVQMRYADPAIYEANYHGLGDTSPQTSKNIELSYEKQASDTVAWRVTHFRNKFDNLSSYSFVNGTYYKFTNLGAGESKGVEMLIRKKMSDRWQGWLSYTWATAVSNRSDIGAGSSMYATSWDQRNTVSLVTDYNAGAWNHSLRADFGSGRADSTSDIAFQSRANPYFILSYNASLALPEDSQIGKSLYISVYNILNNGQALQYSYTNQRERSSWVPSRSVSVGVSKAF
ncbi:MAG: TonB-dependent receptor [Armatimonadota bacterium]|nr:TonB-dependent receptor [bacterium]